MRFARPVVHAVVPQFDAVRTAWSRLRALQPGQCQQLSTNFSPLSMLRLAFTLRVLHIAHPPRDLRCALIFRLPTPELPSLWLLGVFILYGGISDLRRLRLLLWHVY